MTLFDAIHKGYQEAEQHWQLWDNYPSYDNFIFNMSLLKIIDLGLFGAIAVHKQDLKDKKLTSHDGFLDLINNLVLVKQNLPVLNNPAKCIYCGEKTNLMGLISHLYGSPKHEMKGKDIEGYLYRHHMDEMNKE